MGEKYNQALNDVINTAQYWTAEYGEKGRDWPHNENSPRLTTQSSSGKRARKRSTHIHHSKSADKQESRTNLNTLVSFIFYGTFFFS